MPIKIEETNELLGVVKLQLTIQNHTYCFENEAGQVSDCLEYLDQYALDHGLVIQYLIVDGVPVYDQFEQALLAAGSVKQVEAVSQTISEAKRELAFQAEQYLQNAIPIINDLAEQFRTSPSSKSWSSLNELLEAIEWLLNMERLLNSGGTENKATHEAMQSLTDALGEFTSAIENNDFGLISDILQYELVECFTQILLALKNISNEGSVNDIG